MKKAVKIILIVFGAIIAVALIVYAFLNSRGAEAIIESILRKETGCEVEIFGFRTNSAKPFPSVTVSADSIYMVNGRDSMNIRVRGIEAWAQLKKDSLLSDCSLGNVFLQFGSNRLILNDLRFKSGLRTTAMKQYGARATLVLGNGKFISTMFPLRTGFDSLSVVKDYDSLSINGLHIKSGTTDLTITGSAGKLNEYLSGDGDLDVVLDIRSDNVNVNELLAGIYYGGADTTKFYPPAKEEDESFIVDEKYVGYPFKLKEIIPLIIPERFRMSADLNVKKARVAVVKLSEFSSHIDVKDRTAKVSGLKFSSDLGKMNATLFYSSPSKDNLHAGADISLRQITAKRMSAILPKVSGLSPMLNSFKGEFSCNAAFVTKVDTALVPILSTLKGAARFNGHNMRITDAGDLRKYTSLLMFRDKNIGDIDDVNLCAVISDSKIKIFPMTLGVDRYLLAMSGSHTFNNAFDYDISVLKSPVPFKFGISLHNDVGKGNKGKDKVKFKFKKATFRDANISKYYQDAGDAQKKLSQAINNVLDEGVKATDEMSARITKEMFTKHDNIKSTSLNDKPDTVLLNSIKKFYPERKSD